MASIKATKREKKGKYEAFAIRRAGGIPGVVYGKSLKENLNITLDLKEFLALLKSGARIVDLQIDGGSQHVLVKAVQHGTYDHEVLHADFRAISDSEVLEIEVPLDLVGESVGVAAGGMLEQNLRQVTVKCLPRDIPEHITLDVTNLAIGQILYAKDLPAVKGVEYVFHGNPAAVSCHHPKGPEEEPAAAESVEPAAPEVIGEKEREAKAQAKDAGDKKGDKK